MSVAFQCLAFGAQNTGPGLHSRCCPCVSTSFPVPFHTLVLFVFKFRIPGAFGTTGVGPMLLKQLDPGQLQRIRSMAVNFLVEHVCVCFAGNPWSSLECPSRGLRPRIRGRHGALAGWHVLGTGAAGGRRLEPTCGDAALGVPPGRAPDLHRQQPRGSLAIGCNAWVKASGALWFQKISKNPSRLPFFRNSQGNSQGKFTQFWC